MITLTQNGMRMVFDNGYEVSIINHEGALSENRNVEVVGATTKTVELAVWDNYGAMVTSDFTETYGDTVAGYVLPDEVARVIGEVQKIRV